MDGNCPTCGSDEIRVERISDAGAAPSPSITVVTCRRCGGHWQRPDRGGSPSVHITKGAGGPGEEHISIDRIETFGNVTGTTPVNIASGPSPYERIDRLTAELDEAEEVRDLAYKVAEEASASQERLAKMLTVACNERDEARAALASAERERDTAGSRANALRIESEITSTILADVAKVVGDDGSIPGYIPIAVRKALASAGRGDLRKGADDGE